MWAGSKRGQHACVWLRDALPSINLPPSYFHCSTSPPLLSTNMASGSNPRRKRQRTRVQGDDSVDPTTSQRDSPSQKRLANIPKQAVEKASKFLRRIISPDDD